MKDCLCVAVVNKKKKKKKKMRETQRRQNYLLQIDSQKVDFCKSMELEVIDLK
jgi:hypothetical protein